MAAKTDTKVTLGWLSFEASNAFNNLFTKVGVQLSTVIVDIGGCMIPISLEVTLKHREQVELSLLADLRTIFPTVKKIK